MDRGDEIAEAVAVLKAGGLVAMPTETVYGLAADATNPAAVAKIFAAKGRPATNPLIAHVASISIAKIFTKSWPEIAERLAKKFWPGPLTLVLPKANSIARAVTAGLPTVAIRVPNHPVALALLEKFAGAVAAPSANRSNHVSPTTAEHVRRELGERVNLILDGGPCRVGIESTVVDLSSNRPAILRPGGISRDQLQKIIGPIEYQKASSHPAAPALSPGQLPVHYAPAAPAFRFNEADAMIIQKLVSSALGRSSVFLIIAGSDLAARVRERADAATIIEMPPSPEEYARRLYAALHEADDRRPGMIWVQEPPPEPQWHAIHDRLARATQPASGWLEK